MIVPERCECGIPFYFILKNLKTLFEKHSVIWYYTELDIYNYNRGPNIKKDGRKYAFRKRKKDHKSENKKNVEE